jgi:hypothetical protein
MVGEVDAMAKGHFVTHVREKPDKPPTEHEACRSPIINTYEAPATAPKVVAVTVANVRAVGPTICVRIYKWLSNFVYA